MFVDSPLVSICATKNVTLFWVRGRDAGQPKVSWWKEEKVCQALEYTFLVKAAMDDSRSSIAFKDSLWASWVVGFPVGTVPEEGCLYRTLVHRCRAIIGKGPILI